MKMVFVIIELFVEPGHASPSDAKQEPLIGWTSLVIAWKNKLKRLSRRRVEVLQATQVILPVDDDGCVIQDAIDIVFNKVGPELDDGRGSRGWRKWLRKS